MRKTAVWVGVICLLVPSIVFGGNIFIEEGDLFIGTSLEDLCDHIGIPMPMALASLAPGEQVDVKVTNPKAAGKFFREHILMGDAISIIKNDDQTMGVTHVKSGETRKIKVSGQK